MTELRALASEVIGTVKEYVSKALAPVFARVDELEAKLKALPVPEKGEPGKDATVDYERIGEIVKATVGAAVESLPTPKNGDPGEPGKDAQVDYDKIGEIISLAVSKDVANLPVPQNGKDADPSVVRAMVAEAVALLPPAANGKDADPEFIQAEIAKTVAAIPKAEKGEPGTVDYERVAEIAGALVSDKVSKAVADIPPAKNGDPGRDADPSVLEELRLAVKDAKEDAESVAADLIDARATIQRLEAEVVLLKSLPAPKDGSPGKDAEPIHPDTLTLMARDAADAAIAKAMAGIQLPKDGEPGRDALQMTFLHGIEESRSYPRGTIAVHNNALIRAERATGPVIKGLEEAGWRIMLEMPTLTIRHEDDLRTVSFIKRFASGTEVIEQKELPVLLDRGVWKESEYKAGDVTSWDGSMWIAQKTTKDKPGTSDAWRLAVKRGRDGKSFDDPPKDNGPVRLK